jgi:hypothetical protein
MTLKEVLKQPPYYFIIIMFALSQMGTTLVVTFYKTFGQTFINDDKFFAIVSSISSVFNAFGRLIWGYLIDKVN